MCVSLLRRKSAYVCRYEEKEENIIECVSLLERGKTERMCVS